MPTISGTELLDIRDDADAVVAGDWARVRRRAGRRDLGSAERHLCACRLQAVAPRSRVSDLPEFRKVPAADHLRDGPPLADRAEGGPETTGSPGTSNSGQV
jgi:hypothetical protein